MTAAVFPFELMDNPAFKGRIDRIGAFVALLRQAKGGQIVSSFRKIADTIGWTLEAVRQFIAALVAHTLINTVTTQQGTTITICNYSSYCLPENASNTPTTHPATHQDDPPLYSTGAQAGTGAQGINTLSLSKKESIPYSSNTGETSSPNPLDIKSRLFGDGLKWLASVSEKPTAKLRPMVGRWIGVYGESLVLDAFTKAYRENPVDPVAWIERKLKGRPAYVRPEKHDTGMQLFHEICGNPFADQPIGGPAYPADEYAVAIDYQ